MQGGGSEGGERSFELHWLRDYHKNPQGTRPYRLTKSGRLWMHCLHNQPCLVGVNSPALGQVCPPQICTKLSSGAPHQAQKHITCSFLDQHPAAELQPPWGACTPPGGGGQPFGPLWPLAFAANMPLSLLVWGRLCPHGNCSDNHAIQGLT